MFHCRRCIFSPSDCFVFFFFFNFLCRHRGRGVVAGYVTSLASNGRLADISAGFAVGQEGHSHEHRELKTLLQDELGVEGNCRWPNLHFLSVCKVVCGVSFHKSEEAACFFLGIAFWGAEAFAPLLLSFPIKTCSKKGKNVPLAPRTGEVSVDCF